MRLVSPAFVDNDAIPPDYTCDGDNVSPPLDISGVPEEAKTLVLIVDDPDAPGGTFTHWLLWNIPPETREIEQGTVPEGAVQGNNDSGEMGYHGPCPPPRGVHHYRFNLYALDRIIELEEGSTKKDLEQAMEGRIVTAASLVGLYQR